jgi:putative YhdH/YhfP family quinone oxidoreductase
VDAAGEVVRSSVPEFSIGDQVVITGHDLGMNTNGGFAEYVSVPKDWVIPLSSGITIKESMIYGTAGMTAALCVHELIKHEITPQKGSVLVTGATGGVGSLAVAILGSLGYNVVAATGKMNETNFLKLIGASEVIHRDEVFDTTGKALLQRRWVGAIDVVGGNTLSTIFRSMDYGGVVCVLGLVESAELKTNVYPFLQRGVSLIGIDSAEKKLELKRYLWSLLSSKLKPSSLSIIYKEVDLLNIQPEIDKILQGQQVGKVLINCTISE